MSGLHFDMGNISYLSSLFYVLRLVDESYLSFIRYALHFCGDLEQVENLHGCYMGLVYDIMVWQLLSVIVSSVRRLLIIAVASSMIVRHHILP
jgi:hypothetical protein